MIKERVAFVHIVAGATVSHSHAVASLAGALLRDGLAPDDICVFVLRDDSLEEFISSILQFQPSVVLFSIWSNQWQRALAVARTLKAEVSDVPLWVGGAHVTAAPASVEHAPFDGTVFGEGERVVTSIVQQCRSLPVPRILTGPMVENLDDLPMPVLQIFSQEDIRQYPSVMLSRGCPYHCTYCLSRKGGVGGNVRWKSPQRAVQEIEELIRYASPDEFYIDDDTFLKSPDWVRSFCKLYGNRYRTPFYCNARPETVRLNLLEVLRAAGCRGIGIGIESGSADIRARVLQRPMSDETIIGAFAAARQAGLLTWSFNMVGIPTETAADVRATIELNERAGVDFVRVSVFTPYPGTPLSSESPHLWNGSYFRDAADLEPETQELYKAWVTQLQRERRLWLTDSETVSQLE